MEYYGFAGNVLYVDLSSGDITRQPLDAELVEKYIGGIGINYRLLFDLLKPGTDPLSPDNPIIITAGALVGTLAPSSSKVYATWKSPTIANEEGKHVVTSCSGGSARFGTMLKNAGYDHVVITGRAKKPSYLKISDDVEICDAGDLWGHDIDETIYALKYRHKGAGVWAIGRAGENLVRSAMGFVDLGHLGLGGAGAVMGSKNLKAVVTYGSKGIEIADAGRFMAIVNRARKSLFNVELVSYKGPEHCAYMTTKYVRPYHKEIFQDVYSGKFACSGCVCGCKGVYEVKDGRFAGSTFHHSYFPMVPWVGVRLRLLDYREAIAILELLNRVGLPWEVFTNMTSWLLKLYERGEISKKETEGLDLRPTFECYSGIINKIVNREGLGRSMADGWFGLGEKVGLDPRVDFDGPTIFKGTDSLADLRLRLLTPAEWQKSVNPRGPHTNAWTPAFHTGMPVDEIRVAAQRMYHLSNEEVDRCFTGEEFSLGRITKHSQDLLAVGDSVGCCYMPTLTAPGRVINTEYLAEIYSAATGIESDPYEIKERGERVFNLYKLLNVREGFRREDDTFPANFVKAVETPVKVPAGERLRPGDFPGARVDMEHWLDEVNPRDYFGKPIKKEDLERWLDEYYDERGWDIERGIPTKEKLIELGLEETVGSMLGGG